MGSLAKLKEKVLSDITKRVGEITTTYEFIYTLYLKKNKNLKLKFQTPGFTCALPLNPHP